MWKWRRAGSGRLWIRRLQQLAIPAGNSQPRLHCAESQQARTISDGCRLLRLEHEPVGIATSLHCARGAAMTAGWSLGPIAAERVIAPVAPRALFSSRAGFENLVSEEAIEGTRVNDRA